MAATAAPVGEQQEALHDGFQFKTIVEEWCNDHKMFAATLEELAGQLATLEPQQPRRSSTGGVAAQGPSELLQRVMAQAPSDRLQAYVRGTLPTARLQRQLTEQLDQNLQLLSILAAEMRSFVQQLEQLADDATAAALMQQLGRQGRSTVGVNSDEALLMAAVVDGAAKEMQLIEKAAEGINLTTPAEEVAAAATVLQLEPFLNSTLLTALRGGPGET